MKGIVFDIQKFCLYDGPGIRTVVFLKGCTLNCLWCHNPESINRKIQLSYDKNKCNKCCACSMCNEGVHIVNSENHIVQFGNCKNCGLCVEVCPMNALKLVGKEVTAEEVVKEILKDKKYYDSSNGGVTFSGGEPTVQFEFLLELLKLCKQNNIMTALETNGIVSKNKLRELTKYVDIFLFDYKISDVEEHKKFTNMEIENVLASLEILNKENAQVVLRCPVIPTINDNIEHFRTIKKLKSKYSNIVSVDIMAYHSTGKYKWEQIGLEYSLMDIKTVDYEQKELWENLIR